MFRVVPNAGQPAGRAGTLRAGYALSARPGTHNAADVAHGYQWQRVTGTAVVDIRGATGPGYVLTRYDVGRDVRVEVTGRKDGYVARTMTLRVR